MGHFTQWFGDENNLKNDVEPSTFNVEATGSDGSHLKFHMNDQLATNANGVPTVNFTHAFCGWSRGAGGLEPPAPLDKLTLGGRSTAKHWNLGVGNGPVCGACPSSVGVVSWCVVVAFWRKDYAADVGSGSRRAERATRRAWLSICSYLRTTRVPAITS